MGNDSEKRKKQRRRKNLAKSDKLFAKVGFVGNCLLILGMLYEVASFYVTIPPIAIGFEIIIAAAISFILLSNKGDYFVEKRNWINAFNMMSVGSIVVFILQTANVAYDFQGEIVVTIIYAMFFIGSLILLFFTE